MVCAVCVHIRTIFLEIVVMVMNHGTSARAPTVVIIESPLAFRQASSRVDACLLISPMDHQGFNEDSKGILAENRPRPKMKYLLRKYEMR